VGIHEKEQKSFCGGLKTAPGKCDLFPMARPDAHREPALRDTAAVLYWRCGGVRPRRLGRTATSSRGKPRPMRPLGPPRQAFVADNTVVNPYLFDVAGGRHTPVKEREIIRPRAARSVRPDGSSGKQVSKPLTGPVPEDPVQCYRL